MDLNALIWRRSVDVIDDKDIQRSLGRGQFQPKLFLQRFQKGWALRVWLGIRSRWANGVRLQRQGKCEW